MKTRIKLVILTVIIMLLSLNSCKKEEVITPSPTPTNPITTTIEIKNQWWYQTYTSEVGEVIQMKNYFNDTLLKQFALFQNSNVWVNYDINIIWLSPNRVKTYDENITVIYDIETKKEITTYKLIMKNVETQDTFSMWRYIPVTE